MTYVQVISSASAVLCRKLSRLSSIAVRRDDFFSAVETGTVSDERSCCSEEDVSVYEENGDKSFHYVRIESFNTDIDWENKQKL